ncbi:TlyA family RNA methyltransferase [Patescibacteria group bacterium]|nr:TlyA family RNA methyltransferase [Patescibacteria group bacterium]
MKLRLDELLSQKGFYPTRSQAAQAIKAGEVFVNDQPQTKPGRPTSDQSTITTTTDQQFVSRGAKKLQAALEEFKIDPSSLTILDVGASTGGFTDLLLQKGASKIYAVDVGTDQLAEKLKKDPRVINMEQTDIRNIKSLPTSPDLAVGDLSFISLRLVIPKIFELLKPSAPAILLLKPQFEAGKDRIPKDGVIKDEKTRQQILQEFRDWAATHSYKIKKIIPSPIKGGDGNTEYLLLINPKTRT